MCLFVLADNTGLSVNFAEYPTWVALKYFSCFQTVLRQKSAFQSFHSTPIMTEKTINLRQSTYDNLNIYEYIR